MSIALVVNREPVVGVIHNPVSGLLLTAVKDHGALQNGAPLKIDTAPRELNQTFVLTQFLNAGNRPARFQHINALLNVPVHALRFIGCATMALCYVATGVADVYFERGLKEWDVAAGVVIVREAGGVVFDYGGTGTMELSRREVIAARNAQLAQEILAIVKTS